jgi:hypothetical protein
MNQPLVNRPNGSVIGHMHARLNQNPRCRSVDARDARWQIAFPHRQAVIVIALNGLSKWGLHGRPPTIQLDGLQIIVR